MNILLAEDNLSSRLVIESMLKRWGYTVRSASNGDEAWKMLGEPDAPNLVLLDWLMPGMEGIEICRRMRSRVLTDPSYIIMLTAKDQREDIILGLDAGANDYMTKPFDPQELRARLQVGRRVLDLQNELAQNIKKLQETIQEVKTLRGIIPICMHCHNVRRDDEAWERVEKYVAEHSEARFSHGLCPDCFSKYYPRYKDVLDPIQNEDLDLAAANDA